MSSHADLHLELSLALHEAVAARLATEPEILERARATVEVWLARGGPAAPLLAEWRRALARPEPEIRALLTSRAEAAAQLRKASPFAGALEPRERERIIREVRRRRGAAE